MTIPTDRLKLALSELKRIKAHELNMYTDEGGLYAYGIDILLAAEVRVLLLDSDDAMEPIEVGIRCGPLETFLKFLGDESERIGINVRNESVDFRSEGGRTAKRSLATTVFAKPVFKLEKVEREVKMQMSIARDLLGPLTRGGDLYIFEGGKLPGIACLVNDLTKRTAPSGVEGWAYWTNKFGFGERPLRISGWAASLLSSVPMEHEVCMIQVSELGVGLEFGSVKWIVRSGGVGDFITSASKSMRDAFPALVEWVIGEDGGCWEINRQDLARACDAFLGMKFSQMEIEREREEHVKRFLVIKLDLSLCETEESVTASAQTDAEMAQFEVKADSNGGVSDLASVSDKVRDHCVLFLSSRAQVHG